MLRIALTGKLVLAASTLASALLLGGTSAGDASAAWPAPTTTVALAKTTDLISVVNAPWDGGDGSVTGPGISCALKPFLPGSGTCSAVLSRPLIAPVARTYVATPIPPATFAGWDPLVGSPNGISPCTGQGPVCTFSGSGHIRPVFETPKVAFEFLAPSGGGNVLVSVPGGTKKIGCGPPCTMELPAGKDYVLTASPMKGSVFTGWVGGDCSGLTIPCLTTADADKTFVMNFTTRRR